MTSPRDTRAESQGTVPYCSACGSSFEAGTTVCPTDGTRLVASEPTLAPLVGKVLDARFEVLDVLGHGGMGTVYRAVQLSVHREVAIKVIHPAQARDRAVVKRFLREARLASRLNQANIVGVYDFGQAEGVLYLVTELLVGTPLDHELARSGKLTIPRCLAIATQLCDALAAAHAQGIVHRDLKPGNVMLLAEPPGRDALKVLDFGLAKTLEAADQSRVTNPDTILGTPLYMAPEQVQGLACDSRTDLYALGCMLYEMVSGAPPFTDASVAQLLVSQLSSSPPPLPDSVPAKLRALIERLLAKRPEDRPPAAALVREELVQIGTELDPGTARSPAGLPSVATASDAFAATQAAPRGAVLPTARRRWRSAAVACGLLALVGIGTAAVLFAAWSSAVGEHANPRVASPDDALSRREHAAPGLDAASEHDDANAAALDAAVIDAEVIDAVAPRPRADAQSRPPRDARPTPPRDAPGPEFYP